MGFNGGQFAIQISVLFEHACSITKVVCTIEITHKHAILICTNCHKKIFYRKVDLPK